MSNRQNRWMTHPWLVGGDPDEPGPVVGMRVRRMTVAAIATANITGAAVVVAFAVLVLPKPPGSFGPDVYALNVGFAVAYLAAALGIGVTWGRRRLEGGRDGIHDWLFADRRPDARERRNVVLGPLRIMSVQVVLWGVAVVCFTAVNATVSWLLALGVGLTVALGGLTTSAAAYLLAELALRPVASRALAAGPVERRGVPGVAVRWLLAWALGTGVPVVGLLLVGVVALTPVVIHTDTLAITTITLTATGLVFGALVSLLAAYATVHPISAIRGGLADVQAGRLDVQVGVWDSTEMGLLQAGFNDMAAGLRERERIRDLFGRQVGADVARQALAGEVQLGGAVADVAVLFVDLVGSTALAAARPPEEVVATLNRFFVDIVDTVEAHGGWINKFQGDAALAIFGAPVPVYDHCGRALRCARDLHARLRGRDDPLEAGIGVAAGAAVAGHIGAEQRFEYTVIGDPVNEAARLTDLAKHEPGRVLASAVAVSRADPREAAHWLPGDPVLLRGRAVETRLCRPR